MPPSGGCWSAACDAISAADATAASELLRRGHKDITLLIVAGTVKPMSGVEFAEWATQLERQIRVLILPAFALDIPLRSGWRQLQKPFGIETFLEAVEELVP